MSLRPRRIRALLGVALAASMQAALSQGCDSGQRKTHDELYGGPAIGKLGIAALSKRAAANDPYAQNELGVRYGTGKGVARDARASARWYRAAAEQGLPIAQVNLAAMYLNGEGMAKDPALAADWARKAAAQGHNRGQGLLGAMYRAGVGVDKDGRAAEQCLLLAARQGDVMAQRTLMDMYEKGDAIPADPEKAVLWLHRVRDGVLFGAPWKEE